ncbi:hypothetical protein SNE40_000396 [Patella caerulea]|uniref:Farnesoic acid O-methyl transferase domain-containing protein n=1 Tax=Patella caerulea TaxID=87958 RepID=A0AAN8KGI4_PATCE
MLYLIAWSRGDIILVEKAKVFEFYRDVEHLNEKVFWVRGYADAIVGLFEDNDQSFEVYRVVIGRDLNTWTKLDADHHMVTNTTNEVLLLDSNTDKFKPFWIQWTTNSIIFGAGVEVGAGINLQWQLSRNATIRYISVRSRKYYPVEYILDLSCSKIPM